MNPSNTPKKALKRSDIPYQPLFERDFFSDVSGSAATDALSQLCVVAKIFRDRKELFDVMKQWHATHPHVKKTIHPGIIVAEQAMSPSEKPLIDLWASCWAEVQLEHVNEILSGLLNDPCEPKVWVSDLMEAGNVDSGSPSLYRIMSESIDMNYLGTIGLMGSSSAPAINRFLGKSLSIRVDTPEEELLYRRLAFISDTTCHVDSISGETRFTDFPCDGYMCIAPLEDELSIPVPIGLKQNLPEELADIKLSAESVIVLQSILDPMQRPASVVVSSRFLFHNSYTSVRRYLVNSGKLHSIVEIGRGFSNETCAVLALNHPASKSDVVRLIDGPMYRHSDKGRRKISFDWDGLSKAIAGEEHLAAENVTIERLAENNFELRPRRYVRSVLHELVDDKQVQSLSEVADIILSRSVAKKKSDIDPIIEPDFHEANITDIGDDGLVRKGSSPIILKDNVKIEKLAHRLQFGDIIIGIKGSIGKAGLVTEKIPTDTLCGQSLAVIRLKRNSTIVSAEFLYRYLVQPVVSDYLESVSGGSFLSFIRAKDLAELPVPVTSIEDQERIRNQHEKIVDMIHQANALREQSQLLSDQLFSGKNA